MSLSDDAVQQAGGALLQHLQSAGCSPSADPTVSAFQSAYNAAGGSPALAVDGLYGALTQAGLQAVLNAGVNQPPQAAPSGCVGSAGGGGGGVTPGPIVSASGGMSSGEKIALVAGAAVLLAGGIWYVKKHKKGRR